MEEREREKREKERGKNLREEREKPPPFIIFLLFCDIFHPFFRTLRSLEDGVFPRSFFSSFFFQFFFPFSFFLPIHVS